MVDEKLTLGGGEVTLTASPRTKRTLREFTMGLSRSVPIESGLLPPGLLSFRQAGDHQQFVIQHPPGIYPVNWADYEGGASELYQLAQPWRIVVGDFKEDNLLGARMFYSPERISDIDQQLYVANLPNLNCVGYGGTACGWVCLYHRDSSASMDIAARAHYLAERCSGQETYNDANMSETDGPRFYSRHRKPDFTCDAAVWEEKSRREGATWTLDPGLWIPWKVESLESQLSYDPKGIPLTLGMVMYGPGPMYYQDPDHPRVINRWTGDGVDNSELFQRIYIRAYQQAQQPAPVPSARPYSRPARGARAR